MNRKTIEFLSFLCVFLHTFYEKKFAYAANERIYEMWREKLNCTCIIIEIDSLSVKQKDCKSVSFTLKNIKNEIHKGLILSSFFPWGTKNEEWNKVIIKITRRRLKNWSFLSYPFLFSFLILHCAFTYFIIRKLFSKIFALCIRDLIIIVIFSSI